MEMGDPAAARASLKPYSGTSTVYRALHALTFFPYVWQILHSDMIRRRISKILFFRKQETH
jgi:hypothetical protein